MLNTINEIKTSYAVRGINQERFEAILKFAGHSILDVGCGSGAYVIKLAEQRNITGVDYQHFPTWEIMPERFSKSDASQLDREDNSVDTILSFETLEHLPDPQKALQEYYRVCRNNLILTVPNCELTPGMEQSKLIYYHWIDRTHVNFFNQKEIKKLVESVGFRVEQNYYINQINLQPFLLEAFDLSDFWERYLHKFLCKKQRIYYLTCLLVAYKV